MSSAQVDRPTKLGHNNKKENDKTRKSTHPQHKKHKHDEGRHFKFGRKRLQTFTSNGKFCPPYKRRKKEGIIIPPTKFLLGGNICDPLNLNSMQDEEVNRAMNAVTPKSSPLPTPKHRKETIEVIIPPNICDPLNLTNCNDNDEYEKQLISPTKKTSKRRNKKRKRAPSGSVKEEPNIGEGTDAKDMTAPSETEDEGATTVGPEKVVVPIGSPLRDAPKEPKVESPQKEKNKLRLKGLEESKDKRLRKVDVKDKIVSPVIPQPGAWKSRPQHRTNHDNKKKKKQQQLPNFKAKNAQFQYGNYNRYYGYRNPNHAVDPRLTVFAQRKELFYSKDILDIGCNTGHITLAVARNFAVKTITGIDIDRKLINIARKNIKHYVNWVQSPARNDDPSITGKHGECDVGFFPISMPINYGPIDVPGFTKHTNKGFPYNATFVQGNYVLDDDALLLSEQPQFDTILCLSTTKWLHLNFGDAGLKQAFKRMHAQLRPGGVLILESQSWNRYGKRKALTERIYKNYHSIEFFPHQFTQYLLSSEVGFRKCEVISVPSHPSKGFQRPIHLYTKADEAQDSPPIRTCTAKRQTHEAEQQKEQERRVYERELFPENQQPGSSSTTSQQSNEYLSQYEQLENVYAPSATPCYDTPSRNNDVQTPEPDKVYYLDVKIEHEAKPDAESDTTVEKMDQDSVDSKRLTDKVEMEKEPEDIEQLSKNVAEEVDSHQQTEETTMDIENENTVEAKTTSSSDPVCRVDQTPPSGEPCIL